MNGVNWRRIHPNLGPFGIPRKHTNWVCPVSVKTPRTRIQCSKLILAFTRSAVEQKCICCSLSPVQQACHLLLATHKPWLNQAKVCVRAHSRVCVCVVQRIVRGMSAKAPPHTHTHTQTHNMSILPAWPTCSLTPPTFPWSGANMMFEGCKCLGEWFMCVPGCVCVCVCVLYCTERAVFCLGRQAVCVCVTVCVCVEQDGYFSYTTSAGVVLVLSASIRVGNVPLPSQRLLF